MINIIDLINELKKHDVLLSVFDNEIEIDAPDDKLTDNLISLIRDNKIELINFYNNQSSDFGFVNIPNTTIKEYYPLSSAQKRLYIINQMEFNNIVYNIPQMFSIDYAYKEKIEIVVNKLLLRHESFRTSFKIINDEPIQRIHEHVSLSVQYYEISDKNDIDNVYKEFVKPFDLSKAPLLRIGVITTADRSCYILADMHHIISDGTSMVLLQNDFFSLINGENLLPLKLQYKDYSEWQKGHEQKDNIKQQEQYWLSLFADDVPVLNLPYDYPRPAVQGFDGHNMSFVLNRELTAKLKDLCKDTNSTLFMSLLSICNIFLSKISGNEDIVVGTPIAARRHADLEVIVGMFVNTLAFRNKPVNTKNFKEFLLEVRESTLQAYENQEYQFENLVDKVTVGRDLSRNPLFDVMFIVQNMTDSQGEIADEFDDKVVHGEYGISKFDLTCSAIEVSDKIQVNFEYCTKLFNAGTIERFISYFKNSVGTITVNDDILISDIEILSDTEKNQLLYEFNNTKADYPQGKTIHQLFEEQVDKTPDNIALVFEDKAMTYRQLNDKSNQVARLLREKGVRPDDIVAVMIDRSFEMIIGFLAILKSGGAYLPIGPNYPKERIVYMLNDSKSKVVITRSSFAADISDIYDTLILDESSMYCENDFHLENINASSDLAYVIYTSGTTGNPKGTLIEHSPAINLCKWHKDHFKISYNDRSTLYASNGFDASIWEILPYLLSGSAIYIISYELRYDSKHINECFIKNRITISFLPTQICEQFLDEENDSLRILLTGGDKLKKIRPQTYKLFNNYGPTENSVVTTSYLVDKFTNNILIGKPINNISLFVLNKEMKLQPLGVSGELCIGGAGLARGYLGREDLTKEKFIWWEPETGKIYDFGAKPSSAIRIYRTGDLAKWLPDGNIEFLGRIDHQVKIRGFRIELGEIESALLKITGIKESVVIAKDDLNSQKYLVAYFVTESNIEHSALRSELSKSLPDYMIPSYFVQLESLPLNQNGKIDRKALPDPEVQVKEYLAPRNEIEAKLVTIWSEVLNLPEDKISIDANFFELGGHSLKATIMMSKIHKAFDVKIQLAEILKNTTIIQLAEVVKSSVKDLYKTITQAEIKPYYHASSQQKRLYILQTLESDNTVYNILGTIYLGNKIDKNQLEETFKSLINRHESFRTSFTMVDDELVQFIHGTVDFELGYIETNEKLEFHRFVKNFLKPFDLSKAPLLRATLVKYNEEFTILYDIHHIISDGTSHNILSSDFMALYERKELPPLRLQYKDYADWLHSDEVKSFVLEQEKYWLSLFADEVPVLNLPYDYPRPSVQSFDGHNMSFVLNRELTAKLKDLCKETNSTLFMTLLSICNIWLSKFSGSEDIVIGVPIAGRRHVDLEGIVGIFINMLALRNKPKNYLSFKKFLNEVRESTLQAFENQDYQFDVLVDKVTTNRDFSRNQLFDVAFELQHQADNTSNISDEIDDKVVPGNYGISKFDISIAIRETSGKLQYDVEYSRKLFKPETIEKMIQYYKVIVNEIIDDPDCFIKDIIVNHKRIDVSKFNFD